MTCKQEFLVLENGESLLPCRVAASFPSWRAPPLFFPARSLYTSESILEQTILIFTRGVFVERFSCFHEFAIRRAMGTSLQSGNIGFSSSSFRAWSDEEYRGTAREGRYRLLYNVFPECSRLTSEFPISPVLDFGPGRVCPPDSTATLRILLLKRIAKFTDALFNCAVTLTQRSNNRLLPKTRYKLGSSALRAGSED